PFPPLPPILSPPSPVLSLAPPPSPIRSLGYRAAMIRLRAEAASTSHSPPLQPPFASRREDRPEVTLPPWKKLGITLGPRYEVGKSSSAAAAARRAGGLRADYGFVATMDREIMRDPEREVGYGITDSWDEIVETLQGAPVSTDTELGRYMREFETRIRQDMDEIYMRDRRAHTYTRHLMETEARMSREAWKQMAPKRTTRLTAEQETINATSVTNAQLQAMIDQGVTAALAARDALRSTNVDDSYNFETGVRRTERANRECTYTDFLKCQPLPFKGTEGELALLCERMFSEESDKIEKYVGGLPDMIHGSVVASKPKTMQEAIEIATELMDKKIRTFAERETASKMKFKNTSRNTQNQQQQSNKRQNTG
nr:hypothetical protein [Tanacetum cinerariifolium]